MDTTHSGDHHVRLRRWLWPADRMGRYWRLVAAVLVLHAVVDPAVTVLALMVFERGLEANPFIRWQLAGPPYRLLVWHLGLIVVTLVPFQLLAQLLRRGTPAERRRVYRIVVVGLALLIGWGVLVVAQAIRIIIGG